MAIPAYYSLIQKGSYGPDEALVQTWLNGVRDQCSYYPALTIDGHFGTRSENAVKEFQLRNSMNMDGKVGANTWNALYAKYTAKHGLAVPYPGIVMRTGMSGGTIRLIQQKLNTLGEKIGTDGKFGSRTAAAVQRFQRRNGLNADSAVGKATWETLFPASYKFQSAPGKNAVKRSSRRQAGISSIFVRSPLLWGYSGRAAPSSCLPRFESSGCFSGSLLARKREHSVV